MKAAEKAMSAVAGVLVCLAAAGTAKASTILPASNPQCQNWGAGGSGLCARGASQLPDPGNGIPGVKLFTSDPVSFSASGMGLESYLELASSGQLIGDLGSNVVIPLAYRFSVGTNNGGSITGWTVWYRLQIPDLYIGSAMVSGSGAGDFFGSTSLTTSQGLSGGQILGVAARITVDWSAGEGDTLTIGVPESSIDFNGTIPEPGSIGPFLLGLGFLLWLMDERKRQSTLRGSHHPVWNGVPRNH